jgi:hypothetical protein
VPQKGVENRTKAKKPKAETLLQKETEIYKLYNTHLCDCHLWTKNGTQKLKSWEIHIKRISDTSNLPYKLLTSCWQGCPYVRNFQTTLANWIFQAPHMGQFLLFPIPAVSFNLQNPGFIEVLTLINMCVASLDFSRRLSACVPGSVCYINRVCYRCSMPYVADFIPVPSL